MTWIKKSDKFLPDISKEKLKQLYDTEKNAKAKLRLLVAIQRKEGNTLESIAYSLQKPKTTIHDWLKRIDSKELNGRYDIKQKGNKSKITLKQREIWKIVKKLNFNLKVPRQENRKANKKLQEKFKVELKKKFNITLNLDSKSFVLMKRTLS